MWIVETLNNTVDNFKVNDEVFGEKEYGIGGTPQEKEVQ